MNYQEPTSLSSAHPAEPGAFSLQHWQRNASSLRNMFMRRNLLEYATGVAVIAVFGYVAWALPGNFIMRIGCALVVLGTVVVMVQLHRHMSIGAKSAEQLALPYAAYLRQQLVRQRDALRTASRWYIAPIVPGSVVLLWAIPQPNPTGFPWVAASIFIIVIVAVTTANDDAASQLQNKIDELDRAEP